MNLEKNPRNFGKGITLKKGFSYASKEEIIVILDGDGEHFPENIPNLIKPIVLEDADCVIGSRFIIRGQKLPQKASYLRNKKN